MNYYYLLMDEAPRNGMTRAFTPSGFSLSQIHFNIQVCDDILLPVICVNTFRWLVFSIKCIHTGKVQTFCTLCSKIPPNRL